MVRAGGSPAVFQASVRMQVRQHPFEHSGAQAIPRGDPCGAAGARGHRGDGQPGRAWAAGAPVQAGAGQLRGEHRFAHVRSQHRQCSHNTGSSGLRYTALGPNCLVEQLVSAQIRAGRSMEVMLKTALAGTRSPFSAASWQMSDIVM